MSEEKFVICPNCGAIVKKEDSFCGYCGSDVHKPKQDDFYTQAPAQPTQPSTTQQSFGYQPSTTQRGYQQSYAPSGVYSEQDLMAQAEINTKIQRAYLFAWLTFCLGGVLSIIFLGLTLYYALGARKLGSRHPRITQAIVIAVVGTIAGIASLILNLWYLGFLTF